MINIFHKRRILTGGAFAYYPLSDNSNEVLSIIPSINGIDTNIVYDGTDATFNGSSSKILLPNNDAFSFTNGVTDTPFSIEFTVNIDSIDATNGVWFIDKREDSIKSEWHISYISGNINLTCFSPLTTQANFIRKQHTFTFPLNVDTKIKYTYDGSGTSAGISLYLNDIPVSSISADGGNYIGMVNDVNKVTIGKRGWDTTSYLDGTMKDLRFYNY